MRRINILGITSCLIVSVLSLVAFVGGNKPIAGKDGAPIGKGFAVVELFTSEGCSSCPPADAVFAQLQKEAVNQPVYLLAYHVDYWDKQGWKDIFSNADYSRRQVQYGNWLNLSQIYTPQVVVNGRTEYIGSEESSVRSAIVSQLKASPVADLALKAHREDQMLKVHYEATGVTEGSSLLIDIVQKNAKSKVERGENAGRALTHVQIVRKLQKEELAAGGKGTATVALPKDFDAKEFEVLGFLQNKKTGVIVAANKAELNN